MTIISCTRRSDKTISV